MRKTFVLLLLAAFVTGVEAAPKFTSKLIISLYKKECAENIKALKERLKRDKVMIAGTKSQSSSSPELACNFAADNPTMKKLNDKAWVAETEAFIKKAGVKNYTLGARAATANAMVKGGVVKLLSLAKTKGLTPVEISVLGQMTRAAAFTEAHIKAAEQAFGKE